jgi:hypothetical protein
VSSASSTEDEGAVSVPIVSIMPVPPSPPPQTTPSSSAAGPPLQAGISGTAAQVVAPAPPSGAGSSSFGLLALYQNNAAYELGATCLRSLGLVLNSVSHRLLCRDRDGHAAPAFPASP